jgi:hypothetical protein
MEKFGLRNVFLLRYLKNKSFIFFLDFFDLENRPKCASMEHISLQRKGTSSYATKVFYSSIEAQNPKEHCRKNQKFIFSKLRLRHTKMSKPKFLANLFF